jgi:hypothetical protein
MFPPSRLRLVVSKMAHIPLINVFALALDRVVLPEIGQAASLLDVVIIKVKIKV